MKIWANLQDLLFISKRRYLMFMERKYPGCKDTVFSKLVGKSQYNANKTYNRIF